MIYICDKQRHLVCYPYSIEGLHEMAHKFYIKNWWFHKDHYDIPKRRVDEFLQKCYVTSPKDIVKIIHGQKEFALVEKAKAYAYSAHGITNHFYGKKPYSYHLESVVSFAQQFIYLIPEEEREDVLAACWMHDTEEDARLSFNEIKCFLNQTVADYVHAVTNNRGKSRNERADCEYYQGIIRYKHALFVKLCDRIANVNFSINNSAKHYKMYQKETYFHDMLYLDNGKYQEMWNYLDKLLNENTK